MNLAEVEGLSKGMCVDSGDDVVRNQFGLVADSIYLDANTGLHII